MNRVPGLGISKEREREQKKIETCSEWLFTFFVSTCVGINWSTVHMVWFLLQNVAPNAFGA